MLYESLAEAVTDFQLSGASTIGWVLLMTRRVEMLAYWKSNTEAILKRKTRASENLCTRHINDAFKNKMLYNILGLCTRLKDSY